jgi:hypothetical protein
VQLAQCGEELVRKRLIKRELRRKLHEERAEFVAEATDLIEEILQ